MNSVHIQITNVQCIIYTHIRVHMKTCPLIHWHTRAQTVHTPWLPGQLGYKGWHKHYRAMAFSSLRAAGLWVWPGLMQVASLAFFTLPVGFVNSTESNVIMWTLGKKAKALKEGRKAEETAGGHSKSCLEGDSRTTPWPKDRKEVNGWSTLYVTLEYSLCLSTHWHMASTHALVKTCLWVFKSAKSKAITRWNDDGTAADVRPQPCLDLLYSETLLFTDHLSESNT